MSLLHSMSHCALNPIGFHYILWDHPNAHELTNHIRHPVILACSVACLSWWPRTARASCFHHPLDGVAAAGHSPVSMPA